MTRTASQTLTPFGRIMERVVGVTPGAIGGAFAASDGEMVDSYYAAADSFELAVLTAHMGVVQSQLVAMYGVWHYGLPCAFVARFERMDIVLCAVAAGYYAIMGIKREPGADPDFDPTIDAIAILGDAVRELAKEMA